LIVTYDGARFKGWQRGNGRTVQSTLEEALGLSVGRASRGAIHTPISATVDGAGRTDAPAPAPARGLTLVSVEYET
jgi:tRNA U38,U39,U40 pseudouridine synthase TruA